MGSSQDFPYKCHLSGCKSVGGGEGGEGGSSGRDMPSETNDNPFARLLQCRHLAMTTLNIVAENFVTILFPGIPMDAHNTQVCHFDFFMVSKPQPGVVLKKEKRK